MNRIQYLLNSIREFEIEKFEMKQAFQEELNELTYNAEQAFQEELDILINEEYNGDFATFMKKEVLNEDYGTLREEVEKLYNNRSDFFLYSCIFAPHGDGVAAFGGFVGFKLWEIPKATPSPIAEEEANQYHRRIQI